MPKSPKIAVISPRWRGRIEGFGRAIGVGRNAMGVAGHKTYWNLLETLYWIYSRDNRGLVTIEEQNRIALAMSSANAVSGLYSLLLIAECDLQADFERPAGQGDRKS